MKTTEIEDKAYHAIGIAVVNAQFFETAFLLCAKFALQQSGTPDLSEIRPLSRNAFRGPTAAVLNELKRNVNIDPGFDNRLRDIIDRRHTLIHRWNLENPWGESSARECEEFATQLSRDMNSLTRIFVKYIHEWAERISELKNSLATIDRNWLDALPESIKCLSIEAE